VDKDFSDTVKIADDVQLS